MECTRSVGNQREKSQTRIWYRFSDESRLDDWNSWIRAIDAITIFEIFAILKRSCSWASIFSICTFHFISSSLRRTNGSHRSVNKARTSYRVTVHVSYLFEQIVSFFFILKKHDSFFLFALWTIINISENIRKSEQAFIESLERRTTERILDCTGSPSGGCITREQLLEYERQRPVQRSERTVHSRGRAFAFPTGRNRREEKKFLRWQNEYVPMTCKIIASIIRREMEKNRAGESRGVSLWFRTLD